MITFAAVWAGGVVGICVGVIAAIGGPGTIIVDMVNIIPTRFICQVTYHTGEGFSLIKKHDVITVLNERGGRGENNLDWRYALQLAMMNEQSYHQQTKP